MSETLNVTIAKGVGILELGAARGDVLRCLADAELEFETDDEEPLWLYVDEMDAELKFTDGDEPVLREIRVDDDRLRLGPVAAIGEPLHKVVDLLQVTNADTVWRLDDEADEQDAPGQSSAPPDRVLLMRGTLLIPSLGIGLGMSLGEVRTVRVRLPQDAPRNGLGSLTPAQRELSAEPDLQNRLLNINVRRRSGFQKLAGLYLVVALGLLAWQAITYQQRWNAAPVVQGEVIALRPGPPDPFPTEFTIAYRDHEGREHQVVFHPADVYVVQNTGDKIDIRYLPESPGEPLGPARLNDAAFLKYTPHGIAIMGVYCLMQVVALVASRGRPDPE